MRFRIDDQFCSAFEDDGEIVRGFCGETVCGDGESAIGDYADEVVFTGFDFEAAGDRAICGRDSFQHAAAVHRVIENDLAARAEVSVEPRVSVITVAGDFASVVKAAFLVRPSDGGSGIKDGVSIRECDEFAMLAGPRCAAPLDESLVGSHQAKSLSIEESV